MPCTVSNHFLCLSVAIKFDEGNECLHSVWSTSSVFTTKTFSHIECQNNQNNFKIVKTYCGQTQQSKTEIDFRYFFRRMQQQRKQLAGDLIKEIIPLNPTDSLVVFLWNSKAENGHVYLLIDVICWQCRQFWCILASLLRHEYLVKVLSWNFFGAVENKHAKR